MKSYQSYIDGHLIQLAKLPNAFIDLIKLPLQGSVTAQEKMAQTKTVFMDDEEKGTTFTRKGLEYYSGNLSLTDFLLNMRNVADSFKGKTLIKIV